MDNFRTIDRLTGYLLPPSVDEWLPQLHLARFVVEVVDGLDLRAMSGSYRGSGSKSYHPRLLVAVLVYGYATGVFSSRKLERATYDSVAFRFITANEHPDHDTIATFRRRFLPHLEKMFLDVLLLAREMGVLKLGAVALDGTKIHANASRHSALSYEHAGKIEAQLKAEVSELMAKAEAADAADIPDGMSIPEELALREKRLQKLAQARAKMEERAKERFAREQAEYEEKLAARAEKTLATGKKPGGKPPAPPVEARGQRTRSILPMKSRASCRWPAGPLNNAITRRRQWPRAACWWWPLTWCRRPMTSSRSSPCSTNLTPCRKFWARRKYCWRTPVISARIMLRPATWQVSNPSSPILKPGNGPPAASSASGRAVRDTARLEGKAYAR